MRENHGATGVKSIDYTYEYNGNTYTGRETFKDELSSVYGVQTSFEIELPVVDKKDYYLVQLKITKVNDNTNEDAENQLTQQVCIFDKLPKHRALLEEYTGTWCGYCPRGYVGLAAMNRLYPDDFIALSYHNSESKKKPDPMEVMPGSDYPSNITVFPSAWLDRTYQVDAYGGFDASSNQLGIDKAWKAVSGLLAEANIDVKAELNADKTAVEAKAYVNFPLEINNARYGVEFVLVANGLKGTADGWTQKNYYAKGKNGTDFSEPEFEQFIKADGNVSGLVFDDVAVATTRLTGENQYMPETIEEDKVYELPATFQSKKYVANITLLHDMFYLYFAILQKTLIFVYITNLIYIMVYVILAEGFEEIEALTVVDVVRRAGVEVYMVSITSEKEVKGAHGIVVAADVLLPNTDLAASELVVLPGGMPGAVNLRKCHVLCEELNKRAEKNLPIAAICAAPFILGELGILKGKKATCYPGFEEKLTGAHATGTMVEKDGNIITGKGPAAAMEFALKIAELLTSKKQSDEVATGMLCK